MSEQSDANKMKQEFIDEIIVSLGNQLVDWFDNIASTTITAAELDIDEELVIEVVQNHLGSLFRDFDGIDNPIFSIEGWAYYERLKATKNSDSFAEEY